MAETPQTRRGATGDPMNPSLPQGAAAALNEATPTPTETAPVQPAAPATLPPIRPQQTKYTPQSDEEKFLLAPPDENDPTGQGFTAARPTLPPDAADWMPLLQQTAADPDAPQQARDLLDLFSYLS